MDDPLAAQPFEDGEEAGKGVRRQGAPADHVVGDLSQGASAVRLDEGQQAAVDDEQLAVPVAVGEGAKALRAQGHRVVQVDVVGSLHRG